MACPGRPNPVVPGCCPLLPTESHQQRGFPLRKYFIPGCVGRGLDLDLRIRPAPAPAASSGNPSGWAQAGPKWVGPSLAQVGGPKPGPSGWAQAGLKWVGPSWAQARNLGPKKFPKIKILKIQIRSDQNVGKVWIGRKRNLPAPFGAIPGIFLRGPEKSEKNAPILQIFLGGPIGPWWGEYVVDCS